MQEKALSFAGLLVLLGIAYLFSRDRRAVKVRVVAWGVGLQLLLAVIILSEGRRSFLGMFVFASLLVLYVTEEEARRLGGRPWAVAALTLLGSAGVVAGLRLASPRLAEGLLVGSLAVLVGLPLAAAALRRLAGWGWSPAEPAGERVAGLRPPAGRGAGIGLLLAGLAVLWERGIDGQQVFAVLSEGVAAFLALSNEGAKFLFSNLADPAYFGPQEGWPGFGFQFAFAVLPTIIFFSSFMSILYHLGVVQVVIAAMARFMRWSLGTSGSETVSCTANVFVGQTEAPFLVKPFLEEMTLSELHAIMVGGFATIAGGVLAGYIQMGVDPGHLIAATVMSAPAALVIAKLLLPETEESKTAGDIDIPRVETADNVVGAAANGVTDGLKLALNVAAMLIAFIALVEMLDVGFGWLDRAVDARLLGGETIEASGEYRGVVPGSLATLFGTLLGPLAFVMGVPWVDAMAVGNLLGVKLTVNEFVAYGFLAEQIQGGELSDRAEVIATYALCGFANFSSIGIQIGGIGALAPGRRAELARIGVRAMFGGALASWTTATIAGMLL